LQLEFASDKSILGHSATGRPPQAAKRKGLMPFRDEPGDWPLKCCERLTALRFENVDRSTPPLLHRICATGLPADYIAHFVLDALDALDRRRPIRKYPARLIREKRPGRFV
jgi:hypothetical protein